MVALAVAVLVSFFLGKTLKSWIAYRSRCPGAAEHWWLSSEWLFVAATAGIAGYTELETWSKGAFGIVALAYWWSAVRASYKYSDEWSARERLVHSLSLTLFPVAFGVLGAFWPFAQGVSIFMDIVLPFSTKYLQAICLSTASASVALFAFQQVLWVAARRNQKAPGSTPMKPILPSKAA